MLTVCITYATYSIDSFIHLHFYFYLEKEKQRKESETLI